MCLMHSRYSCRHIRTCDNSLRGAKREGRLLDHLIINNLGKIIQHRVDEIRRVRFSQPCATSHDRMVAELGRRPARRAGIADCIPIGAFERRIRRLQVILRPLGDIARPIDTSALHCRQGHER